MKKNIPFLVIVMFLAAACVPKAKFEDPTSEELAAIQGNHPEFPVVPADTAISVAGLGGNWKAWNKAFKECFQNETFRNKIYFGVSNTKYLGTILSKDKKDDLRELSNKISKEDFKKFVREGDSVKICDLQRTSKLSLNAIFGTSINSLSDSIKAAIGNFDSLSIKTGTWQVDELIIEDFKDYIKSNPALSGYVETISKPNVFIITKILKVKSFSANIKTKSSLSTATTSKINSTTSASLKFSVSGDKSVNVESLGEFYVFGEVQKAKNIK